MYYIMYYWIEHETMYLPRLLQALVSYNRVPQSLIPSGKIEYVILPEANFN